MGTHTWPTECVAQWHPTANTYGGGVLDITQVPPGYGGYAATWVCPAGHTWQASGYTRNKGAARKWHKVLGRYGCPQCADAAQRTRQRATQGAWLCGLVHALADPPDYATKLCRTCTRLAELLAAHPDRAALVDELGVVPHGPTVKRTCPVQDHPDYRVGYYRVAMGDGGCGFCAPTRRVTAHQRALDICREHGGQVHVRPPAPSSAVERRVRDYLAARYALVAPEVGNAIYLPEPLYENMVYLRPDIILAHGNIVVEVDSPGRRGDGHTGQRAAEDRRRDTLLSGVGWRTIRVRLAGLPPLETAAANVCAPHGMTVATLDGVAAAIAALGVPTSGG